MRTTVFAVPSYAALPLMSQVGVCVPVNAERFVPHVFVAHVTLVAGVQVPVMHDAVRVPPVLLARHAEQVPLQGLSQQTPSCVGQLPDWHWLPLVHVWPFGSWQVEHEHEPPQATLGKVLEPLQLAEQVLPPHETCAPEQTAPAPH